MRQRENSAVAATIFPRIHNKEELIGLVGEIGFLPFFSNEAAGFSLEEIVSEECWYQGRWKGKVNWPAWEWKGEITRDKRLAYGKLFNKKAGFISLDWFPDFCNYRRDGYDFDARYEDGLSAYKDKLTMDYLEERDSCLSKELREAGNYRKGGNKGFDTMITRLQSQTYITVTDFAYRTNRQGEVYGWGIARYAKSETYWGAALCTSAYDRKPEESFERMLTRLRSVLPDTDERVFTQLLK